MSCEDTSLNVSTTEINDEKDKMTEKNNLDGKVEWFNCYLNKLM